MYNAQRPQTNNSQNTFNIKATSSLWILLATFALVCTVRAQSKFELANHRLPGVNAPVFNSLGIPLAGSNYLAELWGGATPDLLTPLVLIDRNNSREIVPFLSGGYFIPTATSDNLCVLEVNPGGFAWLQVRAWDARLGSTYEEVLASGLGGYGESNEFYALGGNPFAVPLELPGSLIGLQSFNLRQVVPEPSAAALLGLGVASFWWAARRK